MWAAVRLFAHTQPGGIASVFPQGSGGLVNPGLAVVTRTAFVIRADAVVQIPWRLYSDSER